MYTVRVHDASTERKTADNMLRLLEQVFEEVENKWGATVVAVVTDASGECVKARKDFAQKFLHVIVIDCYSHQVSLLC